MLLNQNQMRDAVLDKVFELYPLWREEYGFDQDDEECVQEFLQFMPEIEDKEQLRKLMGLSYVHILDVAKEGVAYIGFQFGCTWENEHGLGIMTHKNRVVDVGQAADSSSPWKAMRDAGLEIPKYEPKPKPPEIEPKNTQLELF